MMAAGAETSPAVAMVNGAVKVLTEVKTDGRK